jgi:hypothetical protein
MKSAKSIGATLLVVFALSAVVVSAAQAEESPFFTVGGVSLAAGKTHNFDAKVFNEHFFVLVNALGTIRVQCNKLGTEEGVLLGSNAGNPGKDDEIVVFSECSMTGNGANCKLSDEERGVVVTTIRTEPIKSEQVENVEAGHVGKKLLEEFFPAAKKNGFVHLFFTGECTVFATTVAGQVVGEVLLDNASLGSVELGQARQERTSWLIRFPSPAITTVWLISGGVGKEQEAELTLVGEKGILTGISLTLLASTKFAPEPNALWSPLP